MTTYSHELDASGQKSPRSGRKVWAFRIIGGGIWLAAVVFGTVLIAVQANTPSPAGVAPELWPVGSRISFNTARPLLIMFAHPRCPCTRASLGELEQIMADCRGRLEAQVWFIKPAGTTEDWTNTDLWRTAVRIPGVTVHSDDGEVEARRFHAETSGQTLFYDENGHLQFQGGITVARGHFGDSPGLAAVEAMAEHKYFTPVKLPVFGCSLYDDECRSNSGDVAWKK